MRTDRYLAGRAAWQEVDIPTLQADFAHAQYRLQSCMLARLELDAAAASERAAATGSRLDELRAEVLQAESSRAALRLNVARQAVQLVDESKE